MYEQCTHHSTEENIEKKRKHINSRQSLNDAIHWSPSTIQELGHPVAPMGGKQVADACCAGTFGSPLSKEFHPPVRIPKN
ncbi:hypothetical protein TNCV_3093771 [Trichonephila clavipes]|nr:hypothetical protein TNCV_3093771 [Trichonephila clavipes]